MENPDPVQLVEDANPRCPVCGNLLASDDGLEPDATGCTRCGWHSHQE